MAQTTLIIEALKKTLKLHGKTYADVACHLKLSEASVKRLFAQNSMTLQRLEAICQSYLIDIDLAITNSPIIP